MIGPQHNNGISGVGTFFKSIQNMAQHGVGKIDRGQISLYRLLPLFLGADMGKVTIRPPSFALVGQILKIILPITKWQLDILNGKSIEVFLGDKPGFVWAINSAGEKERFVMFL